MLKASRDMNNVVLARTHDTIVKVSCRQDGGKKNEFAGVWAGGNPNAQINQMPKGAGIEALYGDNAVHKVPANVHERAEGDDAFTMTTPRAPLTSKPGKKKGKFPQPGTGFFNPRARAESSNGGKSRVLLIEKVHAEVSPHSYGCNSSTS